MSHQEESIRMKSAQLIEDTFQWFLDSPQTHNLRIWLAQSREAMIITQLMQSERFSVLLFGERPREK